MTSEQTTMFSLQAMQAAHHAAVCTDESSIGSSSSVSACASPVQFPFFAGGASGTGAAAQMVIPVPTSMMFVPALIQSPLQQMMDSQGLQVCTGAPAVTTAGPAMPQAATVPTPVVSETNDGGDQQNATAAASNFTFPHHQPTPEFLYQLSRMLCDDNKDIIVWDVDPISNKGRILVHSPHRLQEEVLGNYFRHSKFSSFQRQLNYFGFRKLPGRGKMSPCSYISDVVTHDVASLLTIKRKTLGCSSRKFKKNKKRMKAQLAAEKEAEKQKRRESESSFVTTNDDKPMDDGPAPKRVRMSSPQPEQVALVSAPASPSSPGPKYQETPMQETSKGAMGDGSKEEEIKEPSVVDDSSRPAPVASTTFTNDIFLDLSSDFCELSSLFFHPSSHSESSSSPSSTSNIQDGTTKPPGMDFMGGYLPTVMSFSSLVDLAEIPPGPVVKDDQAMEPTPLAQMKGANNSKSADIATEPHFMVMA